MRKALLHPVIFYFESNTTDVNPKRCPVMIAAFSKLTPECNGADSVYHNRVQPFTIDHSSNIIIRNVNIDWDHPFTTQAVVTDTAADDVDILIDNNAYPFYYRKWHACFYRRRLEKQLVGHVGHHGV